MTDIVQIDPEIYSEAIRILTIKCKKMYAENKILKEKIAELKKKKSDAINVLPPKREYKSRI